MRSAKFTVGWSIVLSVLGGVAGVLFGRHGLLDMPVQVVVAAATPVQDWLASSSMSSRSQLWLLMLFVSLLSALPRVVIGGLAIGAVAARVPYPRVLFYSVIAWPALFLLFQLQTTARFEHGMQQLGLPKFHARELWSTSLQHLYFYVAVSILFTMCYFVAFKATPKLRRRERQSGAPTQ